MGREQNGTRQFLYFCVAGLIITLLAACAPVRIKVAAEPEQENDHRQRGQQLLVQGDFEGALRENQEVLTRFPQKPPGDEALFNMGMIYVHYANPKKDFGQALHYFSRLKKEFPESPRMEEARTWISILKTMERARLKDIEIKKKMKALSAGQENAHLRRGQQRLTQGDFEGALRENQEVLTRFPRNPPGDVALFNMGLIYVHYANPKRDIGWAQHFFSRLVKEFPKSPHTEEAKIWVGMLETMEKTRQIDIEIEEKKRELRR
jgi:outer membrane protein assembly factor BamD (BamD/ComL family)